MKSTKKEKKVTEFFKENVEVYFTFFEEKFGVKPSFDGSAPRDLKVILDDMRKRSEEKEIIWTAEISTRMLKTFLTFAYQESWLRDNFFLFNLNRQKEKVFIKIKNHIDGTGESNTKDRQLREDVSAEFKRRYQK